MKLEKEYLVSCVGPGLFPDEHKCVVDRAYHKIIANANNIPRHWRCEKCFELHRIQVNIEHEIND